VAWVLVLFLPALFSSTKIGGRVRRTTRVGKTARRNSEHQHETITGNRIIEGLWDGDLGVARFRTAASACCTRTFVPWRLRRALR
jgi:hypothetical protein